MRTWRTCTLGDVLTLQRGFDLPSQSRKAGSVPIISSSGLTGTHCEARVKAPGVVIGRYGTLGQVHFSDVDFWPLNTALYVRDFKGNVPRFCAYLLKTIGEIAGSGAAAVPGVNRNVLHLLPAQCPPVGEQRRIASILGAYDDLIEVNRRRIALLEEMARGLFEEWFVRFRFPGHEERPVAEPPEGPLPAGWYHGTLGDLADQRRETTSPGSHLAGRAYVPIECIGKRTLALTETRPWEQAQSSLQLFEKYDILFGAMRAYFHKVVPAPVAGMTRSTCFVLRPKTPSLFSFATLALFRDETVAYAAAHSAGSTIPYAKWSGSLERLQIAVPPTAVTAEFDRLVRPILEQIMIISDTSKILASTRDLLLPRLISGELSVVTAERDLEAAA